MNIIALAGNEPREAFGPQVDVTCGYASKSELNRRPAGPAETGPREANGGAFAADKIARSIAYMNQHLDEPLQVATLAAQARISPSHFFTVFKRQTGCPPIDYFIRLRMERARQLLDSTTESVKQIAAVLGYQDQFYFSRLFKAVHQIAPSHYRRQRGGGGGSLPRHANGAAAIRELGTAF